MRREQLYLQDILDACKAIRTFLEGIDEGTFATWMHVQAGEDLTAITLIEAVLHSRCEALQVWLSPDRAGERRGSSGKVRD